VELSADRSKRVGSGGHGWACKSAPVGPASDVVLPLHSSIR